MTLYTMEQRAKIVELQPGGITGTFMVLKVLRNRAYKHSA